MSIIPEPIPIALSEEMPMLTIDELGRRLAGQPPEVVDAIAGMAIEGFESTGAAGARALREAMAIVAKALLDSPGGFAHFAALAAAPGAAPTAAFLSALEEAIENARVRAFRSLSDEEQYARIVNMYDELPEGEPGGAGEEEAYQASFEPDTRRLTSAQLRARRA